MQTNKRRTIIAILGLLLILALYPYESTVVPQWRVEIRDVDGNLCPNMKVLQSWAHYSLFIGGDSNLEYVNSNSDGVLELPERTVRASLLRRTIVPIFAHILTLAHGSVGPSGSIHATGIKDVAWLSYKSGEPLPDEMRVEKCRD